MADLSPIKSFSFRSIWPHGANMTLRRLGDYEAKRLNILVRCGTCPHLGVLDSAKLRRWYFCHNWNDAMEIVGAHLRCRVCRGRPGAYKATYAAPDRPDWMQYEHEWARLVKRLRNW